MTWAFQGATGITSTSSSSGNTIVTAATPVVAGELLVAIFRWEGVTGDLVTGAVSGGGLDWVSARYSGTPSGENQRHAVSWAVADATGDITVTWTFDGGATRGYRLWQILRFSFAGGFTLADESQAANGSNVSAWDVPELTVGAGDLVLLTLAHYNSGSQPQVPTDFSIAFDAGLLESFYRIYDSAGDFAYSTGWVSGTESYATIGLVFRETGGEPPSGFQPFYAINSNVVIQ